MTCAAKLLLPLSYWSPFRVGRNMATDRTNKPLLEILEVRTEGLEGENWRDSKKKLY